MLELRAALITHHEIQFGPFDVSLSKGILGVVGRNGAGKTSFLLGLAGLARCDGYWKVGRPIGYLPQNNEGALLDDLTVAENVTFYANAVRGSHVAVERIEQVAGELGIQDYLRSLPKTLSGGQRQLAQLTRLLSCSNRVLLLDEPTRNLDGVAAARLRTHLKQISESAVIILVAHELHDLDAICSHVLHIDEFKQRYFGTLADFLRQLDFCQVVVVDTTVDNTLLPGDEVRATRHRDGRTIIFTRRTCDQSPRLMSQVLKLVSSERQLLVRYPTLADAMAFLMDAA